MRSVGGDMKYRHVKPGNETVKNILVRQGHATRELKYEKAVRLVSGYLLLH